MTFLIILLAIALQVFLTVKKISPFLSLLIVSIIAGLCLGMQPADLLKSIEKGVGSTLGGLALIICLGAILGKILEMSGAAQQIAVTLINGFGLKYIQWAVMVTGFLIGIPLYYNAGFVILVPLVFTLVKKTGLPLLYIAIPMAASLSATHCFLPPHPSPVFLINAFEGPNGLKADMGKVLLYGIAIAIPVIILAGPLLGQFLRRIKVNVVDLFSPDEPVIEKKLPKVSTSFFFALLPVILITLSVILNSIWTTETIYRESLINWLNTDQGFIYNLFLIVRKTILFMGDATIALLVTVLLATLYFGRQKSNSIETIMKWLTDAISGIAMILLIITAGGVFKQVLTDSGTGAYIASFSSKWQMPPLIFAWVVTALLRVTIGSATVAGITAAGVVAPFVASGAASPELMVLAVGTGSVFGSHINDSGFWMFKEFFNLSLKQTFLSWTVMETTISILGLIGVLLLDLII